jgi:hypothetical protein
LESARSKEITATIVVVVARDVLLADGRVKLATEVCFIQADCRSRLLFPLLLPALLFPGLRFGYVNAKRGKEQGEAARDEEAAPAARPCIKSITAHRTPSVETLLS